MKSRSIIVPMQRTTSPPDGARTASTMAIWLRRLWLPLLALLLAACGTPPEERLAQARLAAENKDVPAYLKFFTRRSAAFIRDMTANGARSKMHYVKDPLTLLPPGDVEEVVIDGNSAILKVKGKGGADEIVMLMENDEWSIDVFALSRFWEPLREVGR